MEPIIITITENMRKIALQLEKLTLSNLKSTPNYTNFAPDGRFYFGYLGELVFLKYCSDNKIYCRYEATPNGQSGKTDFLLHNKIAAKDILIDTKTASKETHKKLMIPKIQFDLHTNCDYYVAVRLINEKKAQIHGYCERLDLKLKSEGFNKDKIPTMYINFTELKSLPDLLSNFETGKAINNTKDFLI